MNHNLAENTRRVLATLSPREEQVLKHALRHRRDARTTRSKRSARTSR
jgi:FixJ family two-component response regulator